MRFMVMVKATKDSEAGVMPRREAPRRDGQVQRGAGEGRRDARGRGAAAELEGRARQVLRREADRDRRALRRDQGADRRLLAVAGEVEGRGDRVGQALPQSHSATESEIEIRQVFEAEDFGAEFTPELRAAGRAAARADGREATDKSNTEGDVMQVQPYLFFDGRCEEAIEFYRKHARRRSDDAHALQGQPRAAAARHGSARLREQGDAREPAHRRHDGDGVRRPLPGASRASRAFRCRSRCPTTPRPTGCSLRSADGGQVQMPLDQDLLLPALRHGRRPLRRVLDGHRGVLREGSLSRIGGRGPATGPVISILFWRRK